MITNKKELQKIVDDLEQEITFTLAERNALTEKIKNDYAIKLKEIREKRAAYAKILSNHKAYQNRKKHKNL